MTRARGRPPALDGSVPTDCELLDAALDAFAERGFAATSVREVGRKLGVSHNLIPQRFGSKEQLWYAAVDHGFSALTIDLIESYEAPEDDVERLRAMIRHTVAVHARRPALVRIISQEAIAPGPRLDYVFERYIRPVADAGSAVLADLRSRGRVRTESVALVYFFMIHGAAGPSALPGLAARLGIAVDPDDPDAVHGHVTAAVDLLLGGLAP